MSIRQTLRNYRAAVSLAIVTLAYAPACELNPPPASDDSKKEGEDCQQLGNCPDYARDWVELEATTFQMGSTPFEPGRFAWEPLHEVVLNHDFVLSPYEVTQKEFLAIMGQSPWEFTECGEDCPAESVSWTQAARFCNALSDQEGLQNCYECNGTDNLECDRHSDLTSIYDCTGYRLPTEAEWEYAARADTDTATYNGTIEDTSLLTTCPAVSTLLDAIAWYCVNSQATPHPVGQKLPNDFGLYDMLGNVQEWTHDWWEHSPRVRNDPQGIETEDLEPNVQPGRVLRGGAWDYAPGMVRSAFRAHAAPSGSLKSIGFRVAKSR